ncbi:hypothetical protein OPT61_g5773 [Boeremia exigua]|uniref:Uncharacterized protein n=1 Tax=Boeremia exigua TaxID=749465 RepID=A0ACC2I924_9PLEO|nr:hypothetical protein OPT61_g5773 [Boeremia exigua]
MSSPPTNQHETPPPPPNFSHPNCRRASNIVPEQHQGISPMAPKDSRHMLPLPSMLFSRSTPDLILPSEGPTHGDFDFTFDSSHRPGTSHTTGSAYSRPDLTATALPRFEPPQLPAIPRQFAGSMPTHIQPPGPRTLIKSPPRSPAKSIKSGKGTGWRRLKMKVKTVFSFGRNKRSSKQEEGNRAQLVIGTPYDFVHRETHGFMPLRTAGAATGATVAEGREALPVGGGAGTNAPSGNKLSPKHHGGAGAGSGHVGVAAGGLGTPDIEQSTMAHVEDDNDSIWEDCEGTMVFTTYHGH